MPQEKDNKPKDEAMDEEGKKDIKALDEKDINILKRYGMGPYSQKISKLEEDNKTQIENINKLVGIKESDTGLAIPSLWNIAQDRQLKGEDALQVAKCTKIINPRTDNAKYMINLR
jgi:26S proteasome regulatory subunit T1